MDEDFQAKWIRPSAEMPPPGTRCIVSDGDVVVFAIYVTKDAGWMFSEIPFNDAKNFDVQAWMPAPKPAKKIIKPTTIVVEEKNYEEQPKAKENTTGSN